MRLTVPLEAPEAADPERFGPKAANLATLAQAGLPTPGGTCIDAEAYRAQLAHLGLEEAAREATSADLPLARRRALEIRLGLFQQPIAVPIFDAWQGPPAAVRSSALFEDRAGATFAGQFESYLGIESEADYSTAVRACWAALWSVRALRYMALQEIDPARNAMAVLVQPFVAARAAGGGLSRTATGEMLLTATNGPGSAIAQGEVVPDRYLLDRDAAVLDAEAGRSHEPAGCAHERAVPVPRTRAASLDRSQASELGSLLLRTESILGYPVEIEWVLGGSGFQLVQARPLRVEAATAVAEPWPSDRVLRGQPAGIGRATGRSCVVRCECELGRVAPGDVLVTKVAGPGLSHVLSTVAGVVTELGGSTSHLASLARERGIPMVLGAPDAILRIPDGVELTVDGVLGIARWQRRPRAPQSESGLDGLRVGLPGSRAEGRGGARRPRRAARKDAG